MHTFEFIRPADSGGGGRDRPRRRKPRSKARTCGSSPAGRRCST